MPHLLLSKHYPNIVQFPRTLTYLPLFCPVLFITLTVVRMAFGVGRHGRKRRGWGRRRFIWHPPQTLTPTTLLLLVVNGGLLHLPWPDRLITWRLIIIYYYHVIVMPCGELTPIVIVGPVCIQATRRASWAPHSVDSPTPTLLVTWPRFLTPTRKRLPIGLTVDLTPPGDYRWLWPRRAFIVNDPDPTHWRWHWPYWKLTRFEPVIVIVVDNDSIVGIVITPGWLNLLNPELLFILIVIVYWCCWPVLPTPITLIYCSQTLLPCYY